MFTIMFSVHVLVYLDNFISYIAQRLDVCGVHIVVISIEIAVGRSVRPNGQDIGLQIKRFGV